jgi:hypothetical protein
MNEYQSPNPSGTGQKTTDELREGAERVKARASQALDDAQREGKNRLGSQKDRAAEQAAKVSDALGQASAQLREQGEQSLAHYTEQLASSINTLASRFRERSVDDLLRDTRELARREPTLFLAGSVALGFAISRFFKASASHERAEWRQSATDYNEELPDDPEFGAPAPLPGGAPAGAPTNISEQERSFSTGFGEKTDFEKKGV